MEKEKPKQPEKAHGKLAVILIRSASEASGNIRDCLKMLRLHKKFTCRVLDNTSQNTGMIVKVKDYTTFGEIDDETAKALEQKRGKKGKDGKLKKDFHLSPPRGGFERKGVKHNFEQGGALGNRGSRMGELIKKMM